jgi:hypothetical protein
MLAFLHARAPGYISVPPLPPEMAADPLCDARFAFWAAAAHGEYAQQSADVPKSERLAEIQTALAWAERPRREFGEDDPDVMLQRMSLLTSRSALAPAPDDLIVALTLARDLHGRIDPGNPAHALAFQVVHEVFSMAALLLGDPSAAETERLLGSAPAGTVTEKAAGNLAQLRTLYSAPEEWPGRADLGVAANLTTEGLQSSDAFTLAFGIRRLRAAIPLIPEGHSAGRDAANLLAGALLTFGELRGDEESIAEGIGLLTTAGGLLGNLHANLVAFVAESGIPLPPEVELGVILVEIGISFDDLQTAVGVGSDLMERYRVALGRLPADDPDRDAFEAIAFAADSPALTTSVLAAPWQRLAARVREALPDGQLARVAAGAFEGMATRAPAVAEKYSGIQAMAGVRTDDVQQVDAAIARLRAELAEADDSEMRGKLTVMLGMMLVARALESEDPGSADEAIELLLRAYAEGQRLPAKAGTVLGFAHMLTPLRRSGSARLRLEAALLASLPPVDGEPLETVFAGVAEFLTRSMLLAEDYDLTQIDQITALIQRFREIAGQAGSQATEALAPIADLADIFVRGIPGLFEAIPAGRATEAHEQQAEQFRQLIDALPPGHRARDALGAQLAIALAGQAIMSGTDPVRARELLAEADELAAKTPTRFLPGAGQVLDRYLAYAGAKVGGEEPEPPLDMLRDQRIPVHERVMRASSAAFQETAEPQGMAGAMAGFESELDELAAVRDRGTDQRSAELALVMFGGASVPAFVCSVLASEHVISGLERLTRKLRGQDQAEENDTAVGPLVDRATMLLERSRGMLLARMMETRADLGDLLRVRPDLAREFSRLSAGLSADPDALAQLRPDLRPPAVGREDWARLMKLALSREYDALIGRIRAEEGFADFLLAPSAGRMRELAAEGPVVMLVHPSAKLPDDAAKVMTSFALVVTAEKVTSLRVDVEPAMITEMAARMRQALAAINARGRDRPGPEELIAAGDVFREVLSWTWHTVVRPVLEVAGLTGPGAGQWPRIWWIPSGPFNALPLHAAECAGCDKGGCGAALDSVVSSYVPGFRALAHVRASSAMRRATPGARGLLVAASTAELPGVTAATVLTGAAATRDAVLAALRDATHVHFGCHASSDPAEPSGSVLHLPSGQELPVLDVCRIQPRSARLAFLAACATSRTSQRLPEESIHLTSAFLLAGFPEAVGTLWEIDSADADRITEAYYRSPLPPARALHHVIRTLRAEHPGRAHTWSAYIHAGT